MKRNKISWNQENIFNKKKRLNMFIVFRYFITFLYFKIYSPLTRALGPCCSSFCKRELYFFSFSALAAGAQKYDGRCTPDESQHFPNLFDLKTLALGLRFSEIFWECSRRYFFSKFFLLILIQNLSTS